MGWWRSRDDVWDDPELQAAHEQIEMLAGEPDSGIMTCPDCGQDAHKDDILRATVLAWAGEDELSDAFDHLPWVDAGGAVVRGSLHGAEIDEDTPAVSLASVVRAMLDLRNSPYASAAGLPTGDASGLPLWSTADVARLMKRLESRGYARYDDRLGGWNWLAACPACQERRLTGRSPGKSVTPRLRQRDPLPPRIRFQVMQRDGFRCVYCGRTAATGATLHVDHVMPVVAGGSDEEGNLVTACDECNLGKGSLELP